MEGIEIVADLLDRNGKFFNYESFCRKYPNVKTNFLQYQGLIHAIPREWKLTIDQGEVNRLKKVLIINIGLKKSKRIVKSQK